jgi:hypothetical protein
MSSTKNRTLFPRQAIVYETPAQLLWSELAKLRTAWKSLDVFPATTASGIAQQAPVHLVDAT